MKIAPVFFPFSSINLYSSCLCEWLCVRSRVQCVCVCMCVYRGLHNWTMLICDWWLNTPKQILSRSLDCVYPSTQTHTHTGFHYYFIRTGEKIFSELFLLYFPVLSDSSSTHVLHWLHVFNVASEFIMSTQPIDTLRSPACSVHPLYLSFAFLLTCKFEAHKASRHQRNRNLYSHSHRWQWKCHCRRHRVPPHFLD